MPSNNIIVAEIAANLAAILFRNSKIFYNYVAAVNLDGNMLDAMDQPNIITFYRKKSSAV